jgi:hypothetical protein
LTQQFRKYTPLPGTGFTDPLPFATTLPEKPAGANAGFIAEPFDRPASSVRSPLTESLVLDAVGVSDSVADACVDPPDTEMVAVWVFVNAPAVTGNDAETAFAGTVIDAGVVTTAELSETLKTVPPAGAGVESVMLQLVAVLGERIDTAHLSEEVIPVTGAVRETEVFAVDPFRVAVILAV